MERIDAARFTAGRFSFKLFQQCTYLARGSSVGQRGGRLFPERHPPGWARSCSLCSDKDASPRNLCPHTLILCGIEPLINSSTVMDPIPRMGFGGFGLGGSAG
jgi:hypothetical protein